MSDSDTTISVLRERIRAFVRARDWEQFHNPRNLASAIAIEAAELLENFLWKNDDQVVEEARQQASRKAMEEELADIIILCLSFANRLEIDVATAVENKITANEMKYPADVVRGKADKYTHYK